MRTGIFGGSFDPVHFGHLLLAEQCREQASLDRVLFVPCNIQPHKQDGPRATDRQRIEMLQLGIAGHQSFEVSEIEIKRGGVSYTIETLSELKTEFPDDELFLLMGDDSLESFPKWKQPKQICELATIVVVSRPGSGEVDLDSLKPLASEERFGQILQHKFASRNIDISSSDVRERVGEGQSIRFLMPRSVEKYIETQKIYSKK